MYRSREYVLERLDRWHGDRFEKFYTPEFTQEIMSQVEEQVRKKYPEKIHDPRFKAMLSHLTPEKQVEAARTYFTNAYATIEAMVEGSSIPGIPADMLPADYREEFLEKLDGSFRMRRFVDKIRALADQDYEKDLEDSDIEQIYRQVFGSVDEFMEFTQDYTTLAVRAAELLAEEINLPPEVVDQAKQAIELFYPIMRTIEERVFGDIF